jgi:quercetin dioxygenase-like cupin family protein
MKLERVENFTGGWFIGDFSPSLLATSDFEVCIKHFREGDLEPNHFQARATEFTIVVSGLCRMGTITLSPGDILVLDPGEKSDFLALEDSVIVGIKTPSIPEDKVLASE